MRISEEIFSNMIDKWVQVENDKVVYWSFFKYLSKGKFGNLKCLTAFQNCCIVIKWIFLVTSYFGTWRSVVRYVLYCDFRMHQCRCMLTSVPQYIKNIIKTECQYLPRFTQLIKQYQNLRSNLSTESNFSVWLLFSRIILIFSIHV